MSLRLSSRKRGSASLEEDSAASTATASVNNSPQRPIKPMPSPPSSRKKPRSKSVARTPAPEPIPDPPEKVALDALKALIRNCPPKSFHSALLTRLDLATPEQVSTITAVLEGLTPPPVLHCARCHTDYLEEENYERSCIMDHDDDSTSVKYGETLWGCCGSTSEGQEPPAGWCYEGRHTDDRSKARYREDFEDDEEDDGLKSCKQMRCKRRVEDTTIAPGEVHVPLTRRRGERPPPSKKKRTV